jgi:hypothetical protein
LKEKPPSPHLIVLAAKSSSHDMEDLPMTNRVLTSLVAAAFAASLAFGSPVLARGGGGFGGGGHGGFGGGGFGGGHFGGGSMHMGGMGGAHFGGASFGGAHFAGGPMAHAAFAPRLAGAGFHGRPFIGRHAFFFRHHRRFAFFGAPFIYAGYGYYDGCWQRNWTPWGWRWANVCGDYSY